MGSFLAYCCYVMPWQFTCLMLLYHLDLMLDFQMYALWESFAAWISTSSLPSWSDATLLEHLLLCLTPHWLQLMEGAWWTFFRWFDTGLLLLLLLSKLLPFFILTSLSRIRPPSSYYLDVRFWMPVSLEVTFPGHVYSWNLPDRPIHHYSSINHHQFGIRVRARSRRLLRLRMKKPDVPAGDTRRRFLVMHD